MKTDFLMTCWIIELLYKKFERQFETFLQSLYTILTSELYKFKFLEIMNLFETILYLRISRPGCMMLILFLIFSDK